jgi:single-stranded-DNA-specific exonuclease
MPGKRHRYKEESFYNSMPQVKLNRGLPRFDWVIHTNENASAKKIATKIAASLGISEMLASVLVARGIDTVDDAKAFLNPLKERLLPPESIPGIEEARDRLLRAIASKETILVHGDYDADGIIGAVILHKTLKDLGCPSKIFLPERSVHGYGLAPQAIDIALKAGIKLIVTVDCGISSADIVQRAIDAGIEVLVTDHHPITDSFPKNSIIAHPNLDGAYPGGNIAGATVAFKLAQSLIAAMGDDVDSPIERWLPLIAIATVADVCSLTRENRVIVAQGIRTLTESKLPGLMVLAENVRSAGTGNGEITERDIAFSIAPILNAAGRLGDPLPAARLLLANDYDSPWKYYKSLQKSNIDRKKIQDEVWRRLQSRMETDEKDNGGFLFMVDDRCPIGIAGLVASGAADKTGRPACVLVSGEDENGVLYRGSMRSSGGEDLLSLTEPLVEFCEKIGGHTGAIGLTVRPEKIERFLQAGRNIEFSAKSPTLEIDSLVSNAPSNVLEVRELELTRPWGQGNPQPLFAWSPLKIKGSRVVGKNAEHLQITLHDNSGEILKGIGFNLAPHFPQEGADGCKISAAGHFQVNEWQGRESVEFQIKDLEFC